MKQIKMNQLEKEFEALIESKEMPGAVLTASEASTGTSFIILSPFNKVNEEEEEEMNLTNS